MLRLKLKKITEQFESTRQEIATQTKPEGWEEVKDTAEWDEAFAPVMSAWLQKATDIDSHMFTIEDCVALLQVNTESHQ